MNTYYATFTAPDGTDLTAYVSDGGLGSWLASYLLDSLDPAQAKIASNALLFSSPIPPAAQGSANTPTAYQQAVLADILGAADLYADVAIRLPVAHYPSDGSPALPTSYYPSVELDLNCGADPYADWETYGVYVSLFGAGTTPARPWDRYAAGMAIALGSYDDPALTAQTATIPFPGYGTGFRLGLTRDPAGHLRVFTSAAGGGARTYYDLSGSDSGGAFTNRSYALSTVVPTQSHVGVESDDCGARWPSTGETPVIDDPGGVSYDYFAVVAQPTASTIVASPAALQACSGQRTEITVTALDQSGNPVVGAAVVLAATGSGNTTTQPAAPTDAAGQAIGYLSSSVAEAKVVSATVGGTDLGTTASVAFTAGAPAQALASPSPLEIAAGAAPVVITIMVQDACGNGVPDIVVAVTPSVGTATAPAPTGVGGDTTTQFTPPTESGPGTITLAVPSEPGVPPVHVPLTVVPGPLDHFAVSVAGGAPTVPVGGDVGCACTAQDQYGNTVTAFTGQASLVATAGDLLGAPVLTGAFAAGLGSASLRFLAVAPAVVAQASEVGGAAVGSSPPFAVVDPWGAPGGGAGGSWSGPGGPTGSWSPAAPPAGPWIPVPDHSWADR